MLKLYSGKKAGDTMQGLFKLIGIIGALLVILMLIDTISDIVSSFFG